MTPLREDLPPLPERMKRLPIDPRGYPVPWFVAWLDEQGRPCQRGEGAPDFRVVAPMAIERALRYRACWLCGDLLGSFKSFVIGPMCAVNRVSSEPPSHFECADFAARACPFLVRPKQRRRDNDLPADGTKAAGCGIARNPGVALVWTTKHFKVHVVPHDLVAQGAQPGMLIKVGDPEHVRWYREGRAATRAEVLESIESGLPLLRGPAEEDGPEGVALFEKMLAHAMRLVPAEGATT